MSRPVRIWIQGAGEMATGVALALARSGCAVVLAERPHPVAVRRLVSFSEAVYEGSSVVEGVSAVLAEAPDPAAAAGSVTVVVDPAAGTLGLFTPDAVVDARMTKHVPRPLAQGPIPLIGLGPGFACGVNADLVIETHRPAGPGKVITRGGAAADTGTPGRLGGHTGDRVVRAPVAGLFIAAVSLGDLVDLGQVLGHVAGREVTAGVAGLVRGLVHPRAELSEGEKVGDVDPRGRAVDSHRVSDKAKAIGKGVLAGLVHLALVPGNTPCGRIEGDSGEGN